MTVIREFYCDFCNRSGQRRDMTVSPAPGLESNDQGYALIEGDERFPEGWWLVPRIAPKGGVGHACPTCARTHAKDIGESRGQEMASLVGPVPPLAT